MRKFLLAGAAIMSLATAVPAHAARQPDPLLVAMDGTCAKIKLFGHIGRDYSCQPLAQLSLPNGRFGFVFTISKVGSPDLTAAYFGFGPNQTHPSLGMVNQPIDTIIMQIGSEEKRSFTVVGACRYPNATDPPFIVSCSAQHSLGAFDSEFTVTGIR